MSAPLLFVGENNPYGADPRYALFCEPPNSAGGRLCRRVCGLHRATYLALPRVNLCEGGWSIRDARSSAYELLLERHEKMPDVSTIVLLGRKVAAAFEQEAIGAFESRRFPNGFAYVALPHPSGRCRAWNEPGAFERARKMLQEFCPDVSWGEALRGS